MDKELAGIINAVTKDMGKVYNPIKIILVVSVLELKEIAGLLEKLRDG